MWRWPIPHRPTVILCSLSALIGLAAGDARAQTATPTAHAGIAQITSPAPSTILPPGAVLFKWTAGSNVISYKLRIGSTFGGNDLFLQTTAAREASVNTIPADGRTVYVSMESYKQSTWMSNKYVYTAPGAAPSATPTVTPTSPTATPTATATNSWSVVATPAALTVVAGAPATFTVNVTGVPGPTTFDVSGLPPGAWATFTPGSLPGDGATQLRVDSRSWTAGGGYPLTIHTRSSGQTSTAVVSLTITHRPMNDAATLLMLRMDGSVNGAGGEAPASQSGVVFTPGVIGQAARFMNGARAVYSTPGNFDPAEGTLEALIRPDWNGADPTENVILEYGVAGGRVLLYKDGGANMSALFNWFGYDGVPLSTVVADVSQWHAGEWHAVAFTWSRSRQILEIYFDGALRARQTVTAWPTTAEPTFTIGARADGSWPFQGVIDELRISSIPRTPLKIQTGARAAFLSRPITQLEVKPAGPVLLLPTWKWWEIPAISVATDIGSFSLDPGIAQWTSSVPGVASVDSVGTIRGLSPGVSTVTATVGSASSTLQVQVGNPVRPPTTDAIPAQLMTPAAGALWEVPVAIIRYLPTRDGTNLDTTLTNYPGTITATKARLDRQAIQIKFALEEGSRYHGYTVTSQMVSPNGWPMNACNQTATVEPVNRIVPNSAVPPSVAYRVTHLVTIYEDVPPSTERFPGQSLMLPDYTGIFERVGARNWIENEGVKQVWVWTWDFGRTTLWEYEISSPYVTPPPGWALNSHSVPVYDKSFTMLNYNASRSATMAMHNHGHYIEGAMSYAALTQDGNLDLFWRDFVGSNGDAGQTLGRAGWTHMPPNTSCDYDYGFKNTVASDIMDWRPDGLGTRSMVNSATWQQIPYAWPDGIAPDLEFLGENEWHVFWMQNLPGRGNTIPYFSSGYMTNWWAYIGDFENSVRNGLGLHAAMPSP